MSAPDDETRPVSVAELLARNDRIGSPPVSGRRRRRRRNSDGLSVAELTGEIPIVDVAEQDYAQRDSDEPDYAEQDYAEQDYAEQGYAEQGYAEQGYAEPDGVEPDDVEQEYAEPDDVEPDEVEQVEPDPAAPPLSGDPLPPRRGGLELGHDPRPLRRSVGAEQMAYDPVDASVDLAELVEESAGDVEELRSYLRASGGTLFSGETVADDLARRGVAVEHDDEDDDYDNYDGAEATSSGVVSGRRGGLVGTLWGSAVAVLQSLLAVLFGAGLFIGFDQLWRWNNLVALVLSVLVVLTLAAAVRFLRKTEDIVSTLTAVAVGLLVTLGPLALQST
jgi:hypothetical protein